MSQPVSTMEFFKAVKTGQTDFVHKLLEENCDLVRAFDENGQTPLHLACLENDTRMVTLLLSKKANFRLKNKHNQTSFDICKHFGYFDIIKLFLKVETNYICILELGYLLRLAVLFSDYDFMDVVLEMNMNAALETDMNGDSILHFTVEKNNFEATKRLVYRGVKVDRMNNRGEIPLHIASKLDFWLLSRLLLHTDPNTINSQDSTGNTALHFAAERNNAALIGELVTEGATIDLANHDGLTPLHIAIHYYCLNAFNELLNRKANVNVRDREGNTSLHLSVMREDMVLIEKLVCMGADVNCQNVYGQTPLHIAFERNNLDIIQFYLNRTRFTAYDAQDSNGNTLMHFATLIDNQHLMEVMISRGAMFDMPNWSGQTPLHLAVQEDCQDAFNKLVYNGADVNARDVEGKTPLHVSIARGVLSTVGRLVNTGADLEARDHYGQTAIHYAANCESLELLKYLYFSGSEATINYCQQTLVHVALQSCPYSGMPDKVCRKCLQIINWILYMGVDINAQDMNGETALHYGARNGCVALLKHLRDQEVRPVDLSLELQNEDGQTALHVAALYNWYVFDDMLGEEADPDAKDNRGVTPFEILTQRYKDTVESEEESDATDTPPGEPMIHFFISLRLLNVVDLLIKRNASLETKYNGATALICAVERGLKKETLFLLENGADISARNDIGLTALHIAVMHSDVAKVYVNIANSLIHSGADINARTRDDKTPLHLALEKERVYPFMLRSLLDNGAIVDALDSKRKTPLDYMSTETKENPLIKTLIRHHLVMLNTVNMLSIPVTFNQNGFEDFKKCCLEEIELMKDETCGKNSLHDIFVQYGNPTYIFNRKLETKVNLLKEEIYNQSNMTDENDQSKMADEIKQSIKYPIYGAVLEQTFRRAKYRYKLLRDAQGFFPSLRNSPFQPRLPDEVQRMILYNLCDNDLETLVEMSKMV